MYDWRAGVHRQEGVSTYRTAAESAAKLEPAKTEPAVKLVEPMPPGRPTIGPPAAVAPVVVPNPQLWQVLAGQVFWINWFLFTSSPLIQLKVPVGRRPGASGHSVGTNRLPPGQRRLPATPGLWSHWWSGIFAIFAEQVPA